MNLFDTYLGLFILWFLLILSFLGWFYIIKWLINGTEKSVWTIFVVWLILPFATLYCMTKNSAIRSYLNENTVELTNNEKQFICSSMKDYILETYWSRTFNDKENRNKIPAKYYSKKDIYNIFHKNWKAYYELGNFKNGICLFLEERYIQDVWTIWEKDISKNLMINENFTTFDFARNLYSNKLKQEKIENLMNFWLK